MEGRPFRFAKCFPVFHKLVKFQTAGFEGPDEDPVDVSNKEEVGTEAGINKIGRVMGGNITRSIG